MVAFKEGDYFYTVDEDENGEKAYLISRCLKLDLENKIAHVTCYDDVMEVPQRSHILNMAPILYHAPIALDGFENPVVFFSKPVAPQELDGYREYLKHTDFERYLVETNQNMDDILEEAKKLFNKGNALSQAGDFKKAIPLFEKAYNIFPYLFEAVDNQAFCYMDLDDYENAIKCFQQSIQSNEHTFLTDFSIGECYLKMGDNDAAADWFTRARDCPDATKEDLDLVNSLLEG